MVLNAEGLPIEGIDKITVRLNPALNLFINPEKMLVDPKNQLHLRYWECFGMHWYLDIQAQRFQSSVDIRLSIAKCILELIQKRFLNFPKPVDVVFLYQFLEIFIAEVKEIEFAFDFEPSTVKIISRQNLLQCKDTIYSNDRRCYKGKAARKSLLDSYDRKNYLKHANQISHDQIETNPFSRRIEFRLTKGNCPYRDLKNLSGMYHDVVTRYIPYLAILYTRFFWGNVLVDTSIENTSLHPYFTKIYSLAKLGRLRYTGNELVKTKTYGITDQELMFLMMQQSARPNMAGKTPDPVGP